MRRFFRPLAAGILFASAAFSPAADPLPSLIPTFGVEGDEFSGKSQNGNLIKGWLPKSWQDNSEWAAVSATYSRLDDFPDEASGGVRVKVEKIEGEGLVQFTSYEGERTYERGEKYRVFGWVRSPDKKPLHVYLRQVSEPYEAYATAEFTTEPKWKPFEFPFEPQRDLKAVIMLVLPEEGTVDVAGVTVVEGGPGVGLLPPFGTEGENFSTKAQGGHTIQGWLPKDWNDNSDWARLSATYTRLDDGPKETLGAVRVTIDKLDDGNVQLTTFQSGRKYTGGKTYRVTGWVRSPDRLPITIATRQPEEPYASFVEKEIKTHPEWQPFTFNYKPEKDTDAILMFFLKEKGSVDLAGVAMHEVP